MRRLRTSLFTLAALVALPAAALAQTRISVGAAGGLALPMGDFGDAAKTGWTAGAGIGVVPDGWRLGLRAVGTYGQFNFDQGDGSVKPLVITAGAFLPLTTEGSVSPYVVAGAGVASTKSSATVGNITVSDTETNFAWYLGGGLTFGAAGGSGLRFFAEATWTSIATEGSATNYIPVVVGISLPLGRR